MGKYMQFTNKRECSRFPACTYIFSAYFICVLQLMKFIPNSNPTRNCSEWPKMIINEKSASGKDGTRVELTLWAKGLADLDKFSKSDPLCVVELNLDMQKRLQDGDWMEIGRTEAIMNDLDPRWSRKIWLDFEPDTEQELRFSCYDIDSDKDALNYHDFLGRCQCPLAKILNAPKGVIKMRLKKLTGAFAKGELSVHAERVQLDANGREPSVHFEVRGLFTSLAQKQHRSIVRNAGPNVTRPTPPSICLEFYRLAASASSHSSAEAEGQQQKENSPAVPLLMVHRTERVKLNWYPEWPQFQVPLRLLSQGDTNREFLVQCFDKDSNGSHKAIGSIRTSVELLTTGRQWRLQLDDLDENGQQQQQQKGTRRGLSRVDPNKKQGYLHFIHVALVKQ